MDLGKLKTELTVDPLERGYAAMTDAEAAADLNTEYRSRNRASLTGSAALNAIDPGEFNSLDATVQQRVWNILHLGNLNPFGVEATLFAAAFGAESTTIDNLIALRVEVISRGVELGIGRVRAGDVERARS